jgi:SAM-dependent methyltransferase
MRWIVDYFRYAWYDLQHARQVKSRYYQDPEYSVLDRALLKKYIFRSPYQISKKYLKKKREKDLYTYGETPLTTFEKMAREVGVKPLDHVLELGCGRGRGFFFLAHFYNCKVTGIERIPQFVKLADHVASKHKVENVSFKCGDMFEMKWPDANVIYLYGTCLLDDEIKQVMNKVKTFPKETRILSVSYPLLEYDDDHAFKLIKRFPVAFPWGETEAFLQVVQ